jgi:primosomal protein N''
MTNEKYLSQAEALAIEMALLSTHEKFLARITISSLRLLQQIATEEDVKVEDLTPKQITQWFERDAALKLDRGETAGSLEW